MNGEPPSSGGPGDDLVDGLSARRLGALNLADDTACTGDPAAPRPALSPEELAPLFPQLEILECLGRGGMGVVYKARQKSLNRLVALKLLAPERAGDPAFALRFEKEAQALAALSHPNIVAIHDFGEAGGFYYLLMEYVDGVNLRQLLAARRLAPTEALAIVPPVCEALQCAHDRGIVHRDIKPENLLIDKSGAVKIADFGIAKMLDVAAEAPESAAAGPGSLPLGTPGYAAPEQTGGHADHRADIYSLGVVLYEMLTGERPKDRIEVPSRRVQVDVRIDEIVLRALEKAPELRFATAAEFRTQVEALTTIANGRPSPAPPAGLLKLCTSTLSTPAALRTIHGQLSVLQTRGQLILDDRQLSHTRVGRTTVIPLVAIRDVSLGQYPRTMNAAGVSMVSVSYEEGGERKQVLLSPMEGLFAFPSTWNALAADWHAAIRAAVKAATGAEPATTPADRLGISGGFPWTMVLPVVTIGAGLALFLSVLGQTGNSTRSVLPIILVTFALTLGFLLPGLFIPWVMRRRGATPPPLPGARPLWATLGLAALFSPLLIHFASMGRRSLPEPTFPLGLPESIILAVLAGLGLWRWRNPLVKVRWRLVAALAGVWWSASLPFLFWLADVPRVPHTHLLALWLAVGLIPLWLALARRTLSLWQRVPDGRRWLRAWSWVGCCLAVPAISFSIYFIHASVTGAWQPASGASLAAFLILAAALILPGCAADLWRAADGGRKSFVLMALAAASAITVVVLGMSGGMALQPWLLHQRSNATPFKVHLTPEAVEGRVVLVRMFTPDPLLTQEMRMVLEGPDENNPEHRQIPRGFDRQPWPTHFVFPHPSPATQPWTDFGSAKQTLIAFVLPTETLAKEAYRRLGSGLQEFDRVRPPGAFHFDLDPRKPETMTCRLFEVSDDEGRRYAGSLRFSAQLVREGHPRWAEVNGKSATDSLNTLELNWEVRTGLPAALKLSHRWRDSGSEMMAVFDPSTPTIPVSVLLYKISDTRVGMRTKLGDQPNTQEFDGDYTALADEMRSVSWSGRLKTERGWDIELCRVAGSPVYLHIANPPPPVPVGHVEKHPAGSADPQWVGVDYLGSKRQRPPSADFFTSQWLIRAARPGFAVLTNPDGSTIFAPLMQSEDRGPYSVSYAVELRVNNEASTEVRQVLGDNATLDIQFFPYDPFWRWVDISAAGGKTKRGGEMTLHRLGPPESKAVTVRVVDAMPLKGPSDVFTGKLLGADGKPIAQRRVSIVLPDQQPGKPASWTMTTRHDGTCPLVLPVGTPFRVMLPRDGTWEGPMSQEQLIGEPGGPEDPPRERPEGELIIRVDGDQVEVRFEEVKATQEQAPHPETQNDAARRETSNPDLLKQAPDLPFIAWQPRDLRSKDEPVFRGDGTLADSPAEKALLDQVRPVTRDEGKSNSDARFVHFWFSHPLFDSDSLVDLSVTSGSGDPVPDTVSASCFNHHNESGWIMVTRSPGPVGVQPKTIHVRLRYVIGPLREVQECEVRATGTTMMSLHGGSELGGYGQTPDGRAFLTISVNRAGMTQQQFAVEAVLKDGRKLTGGVGRSGTAGDSGVGTMRFEFDVPIASVDRFRIGVREIQTREWRGLVLPPVGIASPEAQGAPATDVIRLQAIQDAMESIRLGEGVLLGEHGKNPPEQTHDPETGLVIFWPFVGPVSPPVYTETFNATIRAWHRDRQEAKEEEVN